LQLTDEEIKKRFKINEKCILDGYTSTSLKKKTAMSFAFKGTDDLTLIPCIIEILFKKKHHFLKIEKNDPDDYEE